MRDFAEFEIHVVCPEDWVPPEAWMVMIHRPCGEKIGDDDGFELINLSSAAERAMAHVCKPA